jgi:23S rRNA pseudouridine1911/1915/1917 synthase
MRLDKFLKAKHADLSWRQIRDAIEKGQVTVGGRVHNDPGLDVRTDADVSLDRNRPARPVVRAAFEILHEDEHVLVLNKPAGLLTIPSSPEAAPTEDTVLRRVREYLRLKRGHQAYAGALHRLDRDTSGALAVALSREAHAAGRELFKRHAFERHYLALVSGSPAPARGTVTARISTEYQGGRRRIVTGSAPGLDATTDYEVRERFNGASLIELTLHTGRQHQIRLHLQTLGHPLIGEKVYVNPALEPSPPQTLSRSKPPRNMLHAWTLAFPHPITGARIAVEAPLPPDFSGTLQELRGARPRRRAGLSCLP